MTHRIFFTSLIAASLILFGAGIETGLGGDSLHNAPRQRQAGIGRNGDYLFATAKAKTEVIGGRVDKACELARMFIKTGAIVRVVMSKNATELVRSGRRPAFGRAIAVE